MTPAHRLIPIALAGLWVAIGHAWIGEAPLRTVFFTATTKAGVYVSDLTAAEIRVTEGGSAREVVRLSASPGPLMVTLGIDESLTPDSNVRQAIIRFSQELQSSGAAVSVSMLGAGSVKLADFTTSPARVDQAIHLLPRRAQGGRLLEAMFQIARQQFTVEGRRALVILATEGQEQASMTADRLLSTLRDASTVMHVLTLAGAPGVITPPTPDMTHLEVMDDVERDRALNDGPRDTGGLRLVALRLDNYAASLSRIRGELQHEYMLTYAASERARSDGRLNITTKRPGISIRSARQVPKNP